MSRIFAWVLGLLAAAFLLLVMLDRSGQPSRRVAPTPPASAAPPPSVRNAAVPAPLPRPNVATAPATPVAIGAAPYERLGLRRWVYDSADPRDPRSRREQVRIAEADFHYPLIRFVERVEREPATGAERITRTAAMVADHVIARVKRDATPADIEVRAAHAGLAVRRTVDGDQTVLLEFPLLGGDPLPGVLARLQAAGDWIEYAEPDYLVTASIMPDDPRLVDGSQWGLHNPLQTQQDINAPEGWAIATGAPNTIVAVIDSGIRLTHEDLFANLWRNPGESGGGREGNGRDDDNNGYVDDVHGINAIAPRTPPRDDAGHGTHVAGIIGAAGNNGRGVAGVAWQVQLMALKFLSSAGVGTTSDALACFYYARRQGAHVLNLSWGGPEKSLLLQQAIVEATQAGATVVAAAGNDSVDLRATPEYPAAFSVPGLLTVASLTRFGNRSSFSNYGAAHLAAPGSDIMSTGGNSDNHYHLASGTSMAAPYVSGVAAILRELFPGETSAQRAERLLASGTPLPDLLGKVYTGRALDLLRPLAQLNPPPLPVVTVPGPQHVRLNESLDLVVAVQGQGPFSYQWFKNDEPLGGATASVYRIMSAEPSTAGVYSVLVTNATSSIASAGIPVTLVASPVIDRQPTSLNVTLGEDATFAVEVDARGATRVEYQWYRNNAAIPNANGPVLTLRAVTASQGGSYHVVVTTENGTITSGSAALSVLLPAAPSIATEPADLTVMAGQTAIFRVTATGPGTLSYQWYNDGIALDASGPELRLVEAQEADAGLYAVVVSNTGGSISSRTARLTVQPAAIPPYIAQSPMAQVAFIGDTVKFTVVAKGTPTPTLQWQRNGTPIPGATGATLTLSNVTEADAASYSVTASSALGSTTSAPAALRVEDHFGLQRWEWRAPLPQGDQLWAVTPTTAGYVAVGTSGAIVTSPDGEAWTLRSSGTETWLYGVAANGNRIVAIGGEPTWSVPNGTPGGLMVTSSDGGATWTSTFASPTSEIKSIAFGNGLFVAVGHEAWDPVTYYRPVILTSPDGMTWTRRTANVPIDSLWSIIFANGQFVATGETGGGGRARVLRSSNGISWTGHDHEGGPFANLLMYGNGTYVMMHPGFGLFTSPDGATWTKRPQAAVQAMTGTFANGKFTVFSDWNKVSTSSDGITWTEHAAELNRMFNGMTYGNGSFVAVGDGGAVNVSSNGTTWRGVVAARRGSLISAAWGPPGFVAVGGITVRFSTDGVLWSEHVSGAPETGSDVIFTDGRYVAVGGQYASWSADGRNWTAQHISLSTPANFWGIAHGANLYVAVGTSGQIRTSSDLVTWTARSSGVTNHLSKIEYANGRFVAVGQQGTITTSADGITWTPRPTGTTADLTSVACNGTRWVVVGWQRTTLHSTDGDTWTLNRLPGLSLNSFGDIIWAANHFVAVASGGLVFVSPDGLIWNERGTGTVSLLSGIAAGNGSFIAVGDDTIIQSAGFIRARQALEAIPARQTALAGQAINLRIDTLGTSGLTYRWLRDGVAIPNATAASFEVTHAQFTDAGVYAVEVSDGDNVSVSEPAHVAVVGNARFAPVETSGGVGEILVNAPPAMIWEAGVAEPWVRLSGLVPQAGDGAVGYTIEPNLSGVSRRSNVVVGGRAVAVDQFGAGVSAQPVSQVPVLGGAVVFSATAVGSAGGPVTYQWERNGTVLPSRISSSLVVEDAQPARTGLYTAIIVEGGTAWSTKPAILGLATTAKVVGDAGIAGENIRHANGNTYDQLLANGQAATLTADPGKVTRMSFVDFNDDIVQVEFSGPGSLSLILEGATEPAPPSKYVQPEIRYVKGHAGIVISGATEATHFSVFSVGRSNAVNQALFRNDVTYDGIADLAFVAILSADGKFGGVRAGNANFWNTHGPVGIYAPNVEFTGPVYLGNVTAEQTATPWLVLGAAAETWITGGDLAQSNNRSIQARGLGELRFMPGSTSHGGVIPAKANLGRIIEFDPPPRTESP